MATIHRYIRSLFYILGSSILEALAVGVPCTHDPDAEQKGYLGQMQEQDESDGDDIEELP